METSSFSKQDKAHAFKDIVAKADRFISFALVAYFVFGLGIGAFYGTYLVAGVVGLLCLVAYFGTKVLMPSSSLYQYVLGVVLAIFTAQFIYQMHGLFEMHFFVFVGSTLLIAYQNWRLQLPLIIAVVVHHALFAYLQYAGNSQIFFTQLAYMDLLTFVIHGALAAVIVAICGWWSYQFEQRTISEFQKSKSLQSQLSSVQNNIQFAEEIAKGNLDYQSKTVNTADELGQALAKMQKSLFESTQREQEERFITLGINRMSEIIRTHNGNLQVLCDELIKGIVKYMNLNQGGIFLVEGEGDDMHLALAACYAFDRKKFLQKKINIGEGLVGQCYLERDAIYLKEVPNDYVAIRSGLGDAPPTTVLIVPIQTQDEIVGVIELASLKLVDQSKIEFVKKICESIAASIVSSRITVKVQNLLKEAQMQAESMRSQEEEMRQNMEELSATQEEMVRKEREYVAQIKELKEQLQSKGLQ